ncbi:alpha/beta fold hydrolase [Sphingobium sp.]|uniref:alpha/beta fold hydrolase n=1 Tax=Sphingobium sp. TaxID=1912891 RepID=UPI003B3B8A3D
MVKSLFVAPLLILAGSVAAMPAIARPASSDAARSVSVSQLPVRNIVLVHGAFADGSGWKPVYDLLTAKGFRVTVVQQPLTSLKDDVAATRRVLSALDGPAILVGHSYAGAVISEAGDDPHVRGLVYIAAFQPKVGENIASLVSQKPAPNDDVVAVDGFLSLKTDRFAQDFAADLPKMQSDFMAHAQKPIAASAFAEPLQSAAWENKPSHAILTTSDHALSPDLQESMYTRAGSTVTRIAASHAVFLSHPREVAAVIETAAREAK